jgi:hypothetical protein
VVTVQYPHTLIPTAYEEIHLLTGSVVSIPKAMPRLKPWLGAPLKDTYGGKQVIDSSGEPVFAELAILRLLQAEDWQGAWIDTYRNRKRIAIDRFIELPPNRNELLKQIYQSAGSRSGCFDVYCWRDRQVLFAEAKRRGHDRIQDTQRRWLAAALNIGLPIESFLIIEWSLAEA